MSGLLERLLGLYGRLPRVVRTGLIRRFTPNYTLGALCLVRRPDGALLLVRQSYRPAWSLPGGLVRRGEAPEDAVVREVREETGLHVEIDGPPVPVVEPDRQVVTLLFEARVSATEGSTASADSAEIRQVRWCPPDSLPELEPEISLALAAVARHSGGRHGA